ncbi:MAG: winged helix-turn-helix transcriptional regulator [Pseudomonadota bacterium]
MKIQIYPEIWRRYVDNVILDRIEASEGMTTSELAATLDLSVRATRGRLKRLVELKLVKEIGTSPFDPRKKYVI